MTALSPIRKYVTLDQLFVFKIFFESTVINGMSGQEARARVQDFDAKRDTSSVNKVVDALNTRFQTVFEQPLLIRDKQDTWEGTALGHELFKFSKVVYDGLSSLEKSTGPMLPGAMSIHCFIRASMTSRLKWLRDLARSQKDFVDLRIQPFHNGNLLDAFADPTIKFVVDQLFMTDKRNLPSQDFVYFPIDREPVHLGISASYQSLLDKCKVVDGTKVIDVEDLGTANIMMLNEASSIRTALAIANRAIAVEDYTSSRSLDEVRSAFPKATIHKDDLEELAFSSELVDDHAFLADRKTLDRIEDTLGYEYQRVGVVYKGKEQYSHDAVIMRRELVQQGKADQLEGLIEQFKLARGEFFRAHKSDNTFQSEMRVSARDVEYEKLFFVCSGCGSLIYYNDESYPIVKECTNCMRVQRFDANDPDKSKQVTTYFDVRDIRYIDFFTDENDEHPAVSNEPMHCSRPQCGTLLDEEILYSARDHAYKICPNCHQIYQPKEAEQETVRFACPTDPGKCGQEHSVRVSGKKQNIDFKCYNSFRLVKYDHATGTATDDGELDIREVTLVRPATVNEFSCPHLGCGVTMRRKLVKNKRGEGFSHCRACGNDIRIIPSKDS